MYSFTVEFLYYLRTGQVFYFLVFFTVIWLRWFIVNVLALFYRPYNEDSSFTTTVIIAVLHEAPDRFEKVLSAISIQHPTQLIVVINGGEDRELSRICSRFPEVEQVTLMEASKRSAINRGVAMATGEIVVLVDSDTLWHPNALTELTKPFIDPKIGGVTTRQRIFEAEKTLISRFCGWLEDVRFYGTMQAMSTLGKVGCLPGRTIAFRRTVLEDAMPAFMSDTFLGILKQVSDDRCLTNLTLQAGYKTVLQSTAVVDTYAPDTWRDFARQQLRWAEGSQYNNLRMSWWMLRNAKTMFVIFWTDTLIPFLLWGLFGAFIVRILTHDELHKSLSLVPDSLIFVILLSIAGSCISFAIRQLKATRDNPVNFLYLPVYILMLTFILSPIRIFGFALLADDLGWGTRRQEPLAYAG